MQSKMKGQKLIYIMVLMLKSFYKVIYQIHHDENEMNSNDLNQPSGNNKIKMLN